MTALRGLHSVLPAILGAALIALTGCQMPQRITIDAISDPSKPLGLSYRLELRDATGGVEKELLAETDKQVRAALASRGLYEAPAGTTPDMNIACEYGVAPPHIKIIYSPSATPSILGSTPYSQGSSKPLVVYEKYLKLSAREPTEVPPGTVAKPGNELWSVNAVIEDPKKDLTPYVAVLAAACIDYIGRNSPQELELEIDASGRAKPVK